jgi:hypothetical protein
MTAGSPTKEYTAYPSSCQLLVLGDDSKKTRRVSTRARFAPKGHIRVARSSVATRACSAPKDHVRIDGFRIAHRSGDRCRFSSTTGGSVQRLARSFDDGVGSHFVRERVASVFDFRSDLLEKLACERHHLVRSVSLRAKLSVNRLRQDGDRSKVVSCFGDVGGQNHVFFEVRQGAEPSGCAPERQEQCR